MQETTDTIVPPPWAEPGWLSDVTNWVDAQGARAGLTLDGPFEHVRSEPWSMVLRVPTSGGSIYFKEPAPVIKHEVPVSETLARLQSERALPLLAVDLNRSWMLAPDAGPILRPAIRADRDMSHWDHVLHELAYLQIELMPQVDDLLALGVPNRRVERLPELLAGVLDDTDALLIGEQNGLSEEEYGRAQAATPLVRDLGDRLASFGIPASLHHGDLHDANVFYNGKRYLIFDWSECAVTHPFFSLRTAMVSVLTSFQLEDSDEHDVSLRLWQGYAPAWEGFGSPDELRSAFDIARRLWSLPTLLSWYRVISSLDGETRQKYAYIVPAVIQELLEANKV